jgi:2-oxoglutarate ferredoxin oxidoreductase subunit alpha
MFEFTIKAFNFAERYRTPVILLADAFVAHMMEKITLPNNIELIERKKPRKTDKAFFGMEILPPMPAVGDGFNVPVTGSTHNEYGFRYTSDSVVHRRLVERLFKKIIDEEERIMDFEAYKVEECDIGFVSYGCTSRTVYETVKLAESRGIKVGFIRLKTIWPFPKKIVRGMAENAKVIFVPEMNMGQIVYEVERATDGCSQVVPVNKIGGGELITPKELLKIVEREES